MNLLSKIYLQPQFIFFHVIIRVRRRYYSVEIRMLREQETWCPGTVSTAARSVYIPSASRSLPTAPVLLLTMMVARTIIIYSVWEFIFWISHVTNVAMPVFTANRDFFRRPFNRAMIMCKTMGMPRRCALHYCHSCYGQNQSELKAVESSLQF